MEENTNKNSSSSELSNIKLYISATLIIVIVITFIAGFMIGKNYKSESPIRENKTLSASAIQVTSVPSPTPTPFTISTISSNPLPTTADTKSCTKYGMAQKWEYLTSYTIKENDSLTIIAKDQLKDESRVNEILKINGVGPLVVGSTLYLPPPSIPKSSGNLKQIYGKLIDRNTASWHLLLSTDPKGQGILIPTFLFEKIQNKDSFKTGDCLKVFLDDGYEVYTVSSQ